MKTEEQSQLGHIDMIDNLISKCSLITHKISHAYNIH